MTIFDDAASWQRSLLQLGSLVAESQQVIAYRTLGMAGIWPIAPSETSRMVNEKGPAFMQSWWGASRAAMGGAAPDRVLDAWTGPLEHKARSNRKRLARRA